MTKCEFIETLSGYIPEKLIDVLAEKAEWDGYFYEECTDPLVAAIPMPEDTGNVIMVYRSKEFSRAMTAFDIPFMTMTTEDASKYITDLANARKAVKEQLCKKFKGVKRNNKDSLSEFLVSDFDRRTHPNKRFKEV